MAYVEYIREYISVHIGWMICDGMRKYSKELIGKPFTRTLYSAEPKNNFSLWFWWQDDLAKIGKFLVDNSKNSKWLSNHVALHKKVAGEAKAISAKIMQQNLSELSDKQLSLLYADFRKKTERFHALSMEIDALDMVLEEELRNTISKIFTAKKEQDEAYAIVTTPSELSTPKKEELMFYRLALALKETKKYDGEIVGKIISDFWWTELNWRAQNWKTIESVKKGAANILKESKYIPNHIQQLENYSQEIIGLKKKYLDKKETALLNYIFEEYAVLHELRKETQMKTTFILYLIFKEVSRRFEIPLNEIEIYSPKELCRLLERQMRLFEPLSRARLSASVLFISTPKTEFIAGTDAVELRKREQSSGMEDVRDFSGLPASRGKALGKVKIALSAKEAIDKIKKGDILVTGMTLPDFVPAMKKVSAIITNEGGITCHAAIISRELKIPCIIGTKIATKMLKDGMKVEVDADNGIVKILK